MKQTYEDTITGFIFGLTIAALVWAIFVTLFPHEITVTHYEDNSAVICWEDTVLVRDAETQEWRSGSNLELNFCER